MSIEQDLRKQLTDAMKAKDQKTLDVVRMIQTRIMERRTAKGFSGTVDDALVLDVIAVYRKSLTKARDEFLAVGERGQQQAEQLAWEISFCEGFLPKGLSGDELRAVVQAALLATGATDIKMVGRVVGEIMKGHKGKVDAAEVKKMVEAELTKPVG